MTSPLPPLLAAAERQPLFGNQGLALLLVLALVVVFLLLVAGVGRWLAATHPEPAAKPVGESPPAPPVAHAAAPTPAEIEPALLAVICAAVTIDLGPGERIAAIRPAPVRTPSVESLMLQWSLEGRRQIYSSHKVR